jgi:Tol biopolymer transport system component
LVVRDIKGGQEKSITNVLPTHTVGFDYSEFDYLFMPSWSPDNKWLVYNTLDGKIYKVSIDTREYVYITDGWAPDWRP